MWKTKFLGTSLEGLFRTPSTRISLSIQIVRIYCSQLPVWSGIFLPFCWSCLLTLWLENCVPNDEFCFSGIIVKVKLPAKFCLHSFWRILSSNKQWWKIFFSFLSKALQSRNNSCYSIQFSNLKQKKEHNIISSRVISSHMGPMFIETPTIYTFTEWAEIIEQSHGSHIYLRQPVLVIFSVICSFIFTKCSDLFLVGQFDSFSCFCFHYKHVRFFSSKFHSYILSVDSDHLYNVL